MSEQLWALEVLKSRELSRRAQEVFEGAEKLRCTSRESGGVRCTRDRGHSGGHRVKPEDQP